ncbi:MAG TPA: nucleotidyltransferase family protein, partial [Candidatus Polarisedimenticolia bacterium]|nr:nucleotidyltransferase family protein [Candidatus Polarisedimenticolia bacterium]
MDVVALLLAAGGSERMGAPKALLPWHGQPLLTHQVHEIQKSRISECVVILGEDPDRMGDLVRPRRALHSAWKSRWIYNPRHQEGKTASILAGLTALCDRPDGLFVIAVDQPIEHRLLDALMNAAEAEWDRGEAVARRSIVLPVYRGRRGHPPLFAGGLFAELMGISEASEGLRAVVRRQDERVLEMPWEGAEVLLNLNAPVDLPAPPARHKTLHA